jgi:hypothetical protein
LELQEEKKHANLKLEVKDNAEIMVVIEEVVQSNFWLN